MASTKEPPTLENLTAEILEAIIVKLQFRDIGSLRLVSRTIAAKTVQDTLKERFASKTVEWTSEKQLQELLRLTQPHWMGRFLQNLTIVGRAKAALTTPSNQGLITAAFDNLRQNSIHGGLKSIILAIQGRDKSNDIITTERIIREWEIVWKTASQTFNTVCRALSDSALPIQKLDVFGSIPRCSLACNKIAPGLDYINLSRPLANLKCLSLSLSHHIDESPRSSTLRSFSRIQRYHNDIRRFLELCPYLETLELHWYNLQYPSDENDAQERLFFTEIVKLDSLSKLRHCRLYGLHTDETTLTVFCKQATQLCSLSMNEIHLREGKFAPVFKYVTNHLPHLDYIHLSDLYEDEVRLICFAAPGKLDIPTTSRSNGPRTITRTGAACQRPIRYRFISGRIGGSAIAWRWRNNRSLLYGPPFTYSPPPTMAILG